MSKNLETLSVESTQLWSSSSEALLSDSNNFEQWKIGMQKISRISDGISEEFRPRLWLTLAENSLRRKHIKLDMESLDKKLSTAETKLQTQISFDLHRTGSSFITNDNHETLKNLLLRFACWNKKIGYCQGLNILAAIILQVMNGAERDAFKVFVYLIEDVLPNDFFGSQLAGLSVDMTVFRHMFSLKLPQLSKHLERLQYESEYDQQLGTHLEPPLVNVFTMQWFITLFSNCFSTSTTLRIWDLILLDGNETLLRTALALWDYFSDRIFLMNSADEFYTGMASLSHEVMFFDTIQAQHLINVICRIERYPFPYLEQLREQYSHSSKNDSSLSKFKKSLFKLFNKMTFTGKDNQNVDVDDFEEQLVLATFCVDDDSNRITQLNDKNEVYSSFNNKNEQNSCTSKIDQIIRHLHLNSLSHHNGNNSASLSVLKRQYIKFKQRQKQAQSILCNLNSNMKNSASNSLKDLSKNSRLYRRSNTITSFLSETINEATRMVKRDLNKLSAGQLQAKPKSQTALMEQYQSRLVLKGSPQHCYDSLKNHHHIYRHPHHQQQQQQTPLNTRLSLSDHNRSVLFTLGSDSSASTELCDDSSPISNTSQNELFFDENKQLQLIVKTIHLSNRQLSYSLNDLTTLKCHSLNKNKSSLYRINELSLQIKQISLDND